MAALSRGVEEPTGAKKAALGKPKRSQGQRPGFGLSNRKPGAGKGAGGVAGEDQDFGWRVARGAGDVCGDAQLAVVGGGSLGLRREGGGGSGFQASVPREGAEPAKAGGLASDR